MSHSSRPKEPIFSAISVGFFLILAGAIFAHAAFVTKTNLFNEISAFFQDFEIVKVPNTEAFSLPAPESPRRHLDVYSALFKFSLVWGFYQIAILAVRFMVGSPLDKKAETVSNLVFWFGASYLLNAYLIKTTVWFEFWALIIVLAGISLIARAIVLAFRS